MRLLILVGILIGIVGQGFGITLSEMRTRTRKLVGDYITTTVGGSTLDTTKIRWQESDITAVINEGHIDVCRKSGLIHKTAYIATSTSTVIYYDLPADFLAIEDVAIYYSLARSTTYYQKVLYTERPRLDSEDTGWEAKTGQRPETYHLLYTSYNVQIGLYPPVSSTYAGSNYLRVRYIMKVADLSGDSDVPFNSLSHLYPYHKSLIYFACAWLKRDEGKFTDAQEFERLYLTEINRMINEATSTPDYRGGIISEEYNNTRGGMK